MARLKLLIHKGRKKVLMAEAGKDFMDFVFGLMALPVASVISLLNEQQMVGCIANLYKSIENMEEPYFESEDNKVFLLNPLSDFPQSHIISPLLPSKAFYKTTYYTCTCTCTSTCTIYDLVLHLSCKAGTRCSRCNNGMHKECVLPGSTSHTGGFVKEMVTFMVMDDLTVSPMSSITNIALFKKFQVADLADLEEKVVDVGLKEGLAVLKASLQSKTVLTDVFMG